MSDVPPMHIVLASVDAAVRHEFGCYYLADELPAVMDDSWLEAMTRSSAGRMSAHVGAANLDTVIAARKERRRITLRMRIIPRIIQSQHL